MEMIYCKKWWFPRKKPIEILTEETARKSHQSKADIKMRDTMTLW